MQKNENETFWKHLLTNRYQTTHKNKFFGKVIRKTIFYFTKYKHTTGLKVDQIIFLI